MPFKRLAGQALNILPDRMNLFLRYMSGVGNEGLELDESTLRSLRAATEKQDFLVDYIDPKEAARQQFLMSPEREAEFAAVAERAQTEQRKQQNRELGLPDVTPLDREAIEMLRKSRAVRSGDFESLFPGGVRKSHSRCLHRKWVPASLRLGP